MWELRKSLEQFLIAKMSLIEQSQIVASREICPICGGLHYSNYHRSSNGYKFTAEVRNAAREKAGNVCAICGQDNSFDVHHLLAIWAYKALLSSGSLPEELQNLNKAVLTSEYNALVVCESCHDELHYLDELALGDAKKEAERLEFYRWMAVNLLCLFHGSDKI